MQKIESLTPEQELALIEWRENWRAVGFSTEPADRPRAERAVAQMYREIGKEPPRFLWFDSPMACLLIQGLLLQSKAVKRGQLRDQLGGQLRDQLRGQLRDQLWGQLRDQLGDQLRGQLGDQLWGQLRDQLRDQLGGQLWDQLWGQLGGQLRDQLWRVFWGQHEVYWTSYYAFAREIGVTFTDQQSARLDLWSEVGSSACWWWPFENICVISDRPELVSFDDNQRLHSADGPALRFRDGYSVHAWHGLRVKPKVINHDFTHADIISEQNAEVRRAMVEIHTPERYIQECGAKKLDTDDWGTLWQADFQDDEPLTMVEVVNSTLEPDGSAHRFFLRVAPNCRPLFTDNRDTEPQELTALNAIASTFGMTGEEYASDLVAQS